MKSKKVYIGIIAIIISLGIVIASIFYIKANNKDVEILGFIKNNANENTKEAMQETKDSSDTDEKKEEIEESKDVSKEVQNNVAEQNSVEQNNEEENKKEEEQKVEETKKEIEVTPMSKTMYVNVDSLNIRSGPDTSYSKLGALKKASEVKITGKSGAWYRISYNKKDGFVLGSYLSSTKPVIEEKTSYEVSNIQQKTNNSSNTEKASSTVNHLIIINSRANTLRYYVSGKLSRSYRCATGTSGTPTPQGKFAIFEKLENRPYYKANIPGGAANNPLGPRWMQFKSGGYAIHGTNTDSSIGTNASHGCVRMHNSDVIELYSLVPNGTTVIVKNTSQSDKDIAAGYGISIE